MVRFILTSIMALSMVSMLNSKPEDLINTTWSGKINVPDPVDAEMEFRNDSLFTYIGTDLVETTSFKIKGDTLILQKISGMSTCDQQPADYKYTIKDEVLKLEALNDNCAERKSAFSNDGFKRLK
ncbi:hypothetical protein [Pedobacter immunditicola]|uniref:hypothetical protein n=1 Tax=Pedobacter immunditicola TaxID=3133440 RepID=UPI00309A7144